MLWKAENAYAWKIKTYILFYCQVEVTFTEHHERYISSLRGNARRSVSIRCPTYGRAIDKLFKLRTKLLRLKSQTNWMFFF